MKYPHLSSPRTVIVTLSPLRSLADRFGLSWPHTTEPCQSVSVVVRTQMKRPVALVAAIQSALAQEVAPVEVIVVAHAVDSPPASLPSADVLSASVSSAHLLPSADLLVERVRHLLAARLGAGDLAMVRVIGAAGGRRGHPINIGFSNAVGDLVVLLDDDDLAQPNWISTFVSVAAEIAVPAVIRAGSTEVPGRWTISTNGDHVFETVGEPRASDLDPLSLPSLLFRCRSTPASVAYPRLLMQQLRLDADPDLELFEDWDLLTRAAQVIGYANVSTVTSEYRLDVDGGSVAAEATDAANRSFIYMRKGIDASPLVLPPGSLRYLMDMHHRAQKDETSNKR